MNKKELVSEMAEAAAISKTEAEKALDGFMNAVTASVSKGGTVQLTGFGTFSVSNRSARTTRNPQTGEMMKVPAKKVVKFKAGSKLNGTVN